jgi:hypothetical protein
MAKKKYKKPIMVPGAEDKMHEMRYAITKQMGWLVINADDWWEVLTPMQKSQVNGMVTKLMVEKAKRDLNNNLWR